VGSYHRAFWATEQAGIDVSRRDRASGSYLAYIPDSLAHRAFSIAGDTVADIEEAAAAVSRLDAHAGPLTNTEALARILLRAESVASSFIEGLEVSPARLLHADFARANGPSNDDVTANAVLGNVDAMSYAIAHATEPLTPALIKGIHRRLLAETRFASIAGEIRTKQNWIGGSEFNPLGADFVPPPPELVDELLEDLCTFANRDDVSALAQAAIAHAQFETIHPFADGNGRTGRALIHMIMRRRGLGTRIVPPISLILATHSRDYVRHLQQSHYEGTPEAAAARAALDDWLGFFAACTRRAAHDALSFEDRISAIQEKWLSKLSAARAHSGARALIEHLPASPLITIQNAMVLLGRSMTTTTQAIETLVEAGILRPTSDRKRGQVFEAGDVIGAFRDLERQLASPAADTRIEPPSRPVPQRVRRRG
jgi:Fic family protein